MSDISIIDGRVCKIPKIKETKRTSFYYKPIIHGLDLEEFKYLNTVDLEDRNYGELLTYNPGIMVYVFSNGWYIAFAENLAIRFSNDFGRLRHGKHSAKRLQIEYNKERFIGCYFLASEDLTRRNRDIKRREVLHLNKKELLMFNPVKTSVIRETIPVVIEGVEYTGMPQASASLNLSYNLVYRRVTSRSNWPDWKFLNEKLNLPPKVRHPGIAKPVIINGVSYPSISKASDHLDIDTETITRRLDSLNFIWGKWNYI